MVPQAGTRVMGLAPRARAARLPCLPSTLLSAEQRECEATLPGGGTLGGN